MNDLSEPGPGERRRTPRAAVDVRCQAVAEYDFFLLGEEIVNLSSEGLLLRSDGTPAQVGERVLVSFQPPESEHWIDANGTVVRLVTGQTPGAPGVGLRLDPLPPFERGLLTAALELSARPRPSAPPLIRFRRRRAEHDVVAREVRVVGQRATPGDARRARVIVVA